MRLNLNGYTPKQYAVLILRQDEKKSIREIAQRMQMSESGVRYILKMKSR
jgi:DNA-directed RNA polymerase specialized sigma24 family protein